MKSWPLALVCVALTFACMKKPDLTASDGDVVQPAAVQEALGSAWGATEALAISQDEEAYVEYTSAVAGMAPRVLLTDDKSIGDVDDSDDERGYLMLERIVEYDDNNQQAAASNYRHLHIDKHAAHPTFRPTDAGDQAVPMSSELLDSLKQTCFTTAAAQVDCHNLASWDSIEDAPKMVAAQANCAGLPRCQLHVKNVSFDAFVNTVGADKSKVRSKISYLVKISPDLPYLSRLLSSCSTGLGSAQNYNFPVTTCASLRNFHRGTGNP